MKIFLGADHRGFNLKEQLKTWLVGEGHEVHDAGAERLDPTDDYPDFAVAVAKAVQEDATARGIVVCGSGVGMAIAANKIPGVRASVITSPQLATTSRRDDDTNVISLGADVTSDADAKSIVTTWLTTEFSGEERHQRRIDKISQLEQ